MKIIEPTHKIDIDIPSWNEWIMWADISLISDEVWSRYAQEETVSHLYNQLEFSKDYWNCLCTIYWPITQLSIVTGREITTAERNELVIRRYNDSDFNPNVGWFVTYGIDTLRRWWNANNPDNKLVTFRIPNRSSLRDVFFQRWLPLTTSFNWNREYSLDSIDWVLDKLDYNKYPKTYWHCLAMFQLRKLDNYNREYRYKSIEDYQAMLNVFTETANSYAMFLENDLTDDGKKLVHFMRIWLWDGSRPADPITRWEASRMAMILDVWTEEKHIWNSKNPHSPASKYEVSVMFSRTNPWSKPYLWTDRNKIITRAEAVLLLPY